MNERHRLDEISARTNYGDGVNGSMIEFGARVARAWIKPGRVLELGPAEGKSTKILSVGLESYEVVEASASYCAELRLQLPHITVHNCLFEEFIPSSGFSTIILGHVLEHVEDPNEILHLAASWLEPDGLIIAATPNAMSLHRQLGVLAGMLQSETDLNESDYSIGHRRVFSPDSLQGLIQSCSLLELVHFGGYFLKPFSNSQLDTIANESLLMSLMKLGERYPSIAGDIFVVARHRGRE
jgi:trans-aconitate methyltransferase